MGNTAKMPTPRPQEIVEIGILKLLRRYAENMIRQQVEDPAAYPACFYSKDRLKDGMIRSFDRVNAFGDGKTGENDYYTTIEGFNVALDSAYKKGWVAAQKDIPKGVLPHETKNNPFAITKLGMEKLLELKKTLTPAPASVRSV